MIWLKALLMLLAVLNGQSNLADTYQGPYEVPAVEAPLPYPVETGSIGPAVAAISAADIVEQFSRGYFEAGGPAYAWPAVVEMVRCESSWLLYTDGPYNGLAQFDWPTWAEAGGGNPYDPYDQGRNVAYFVKRGDNRWKACLKI